MTAEPFFISPSCGTHSSRTTAKRKGQVHGSRPHETGTLRPEGDELVDGLSRFRELPEVRRGRWNLRQRGVVRARCAEIEQDGLSGEEPEYGVDPDNPDGPEIKLTDLCGPEEARARLGGVYGANGGRAAEAFLPTGERIAVFHPLPGGELGFLNGLTQRWAIVRSMTW